MNKGKLVFRIFNPIITACLLITFIDGNTQTIKRTLTAYLFTYFTGRKKGEETIRFVISNDGYNFRALKEVIPTKRGINALSLK